jgi:transcriptional regulator with XRE-family HTH domain
MTLLDVAERCPGMHLSTLSRIERGEIDPSLESQLIPIAHALGLTLSALLTNLQPKQENIHDSASGTNRKARLR